MNTTAIRSNGQPQAILNSFFELLTQLNAFAKKPAAIRKLERSKVSDFDLINLSNTGVQKLFLDVLATDLGITRKFLAENILSVSVKTIERKGLHDTLDKQLSSHALEIAKVLQHAFEVFEDEEKVKRWIAKPNRALNSKKPIELLDTLTGINLVNDILGRIEEGVYS